MTRTTFLAICGLAALAGLAAEAKAWGLSTIAVALLIVVFVSALLERDA